MDDTVSTNNLTNKTGGGHYFRTDLEAQELRRRLRYEPDTGLFFRQSGRGLSKAEPAGCIDYRGYVMIGFRGKTYAAHRLAWAWMTGQFPDGPLDHVNRVRSDNRWCNLRLADYRLNAANKAGKDRDLPKGVYRHHDRFRALIKPADKIVHLGVYDTPEEAAAAYYGAAKIAFGKFANKG